MRRKAMATRSKGATKAKASNVKSKPRSSRGKERKKPFQLEEATIDDLHRAIKTGKTTVVAVVQHYIERVRKYNGVASVLVTRDGEPVAEANGTVRGEAPLEFPTETLKVADLLPDLEKYQGPPLEFGRMEATASDPTVQQQFGMIAGIKNGTQLNALATLNIRGERSAVCPGDYDRHPADGPLPEGAPAVCEILRRMPDALERAAELDKKYGRNPDLKKMPMYGVVFSF
jgi:amidase